MRVIVIVPAQRRRRVQTPGKGDFRLSTGLAQEMQKVGSRYFGKFRLRDQSVHAKPAQGAENQAAYRRLDVERTQPAGDVCGVTATLPSCDTKAFVCQFHQ